MITKIGNDAYLDYPLALTGKQKKLLRKYYKIPDHVDLDALEKAQIAKGARLGALIGAPTAVAADLLGRSMLDMPPEHAAMRGEVRLGLALGGIGGGIIGSSVAGGKYTPGGANKIVKELGARDAADALRMLERAEAARSGASALAHGASLRRLLGAIK